MRPSHAAMPASYIYTSFRGACIGLREIPWEDEEEGATSPDEELQHSAKKPPREASIQKKLLKRTTKEPDPTTCTYGCRQNAADSMLQLQSEGIFDVAAPKTDVGWSQNDPAPPQSRGGNSELAGSVRPRTKGRNAVCYDWPNENVFTFTSLGRRNRTAKQRI